MEDEYHKRDKKRVAGDVKDAPAAKKHSNSPPSAETQEQEGTKQIAKEDEDEEEEDEDEDEEDTGDEDEDADEDEDSDQGDEEASCGAPGEQKGVGDGKSAADVLIVGQRCLCWSLPCVCVCVCVFELFCAGFESLLLDRCSRQRLIILRLF